MSEQLHALLDVVARETGAAPARRPPAQQTVHLPPPLAAFYAVADGLDLPFVEVFRSVDVHPSGVPGWLAFGADRYFSICLCQVSAPWRMDLWDHESALQPEGSFTEVPEVLGAAYEAWCSSDRACSLTIEAVPAGSRLTPVVAALKTLVPGNSSTLLDGLRHLPLTLACHNRSAAIAVLRALQAQGVRCRWEAA
jgi:hypothetical protein